MTTSNVLFLALGGDRQRVVIQDSARVVAAGGRAVVIIDDISVWRTRRRFASGVRVVDLPTLQSQALPAKVARRLLYSIPRRLFRLVGRIPLMSWAQRVGAAYERHIADVLDARLVTPVYQWLRGDDNRHRLLRRLVLRKGAFDVVVICDPPSIPVAARLAEQRSIASLLTYDLAGHEAFRGDTAAA